MNLNQNDITYICIAIGYTILLVGYDKYINYNNITEENTLVILKTILNVFVYMGILLTWFFTKQSTQYNNPGLLLTIGYAAATLLFSAIILYITFEGLEYFMENGIVTKSKNTPVLPEKNYCPDTCNWFTTKNVCTTNKTWNGLTCAWNASQQLCYTPEPTKPWIRNVTRTILVLVTLIILVLLVFSHDQIIKQIEKYPNLKWILDIPNVILNGINKFKHDINITSSTTWILILIELFVIGLYFFANFFAYQAYNKHGIIIHNPPLGLNYKTKVGCETLNQIHTYQKENTDDIDNKYKITIQEGAVTNFLPITDDVKQQIIDYNKGPIPKNTYSLTSDFIIHKDKTTKKANSDNNSINYNYGISLWFHIDPHQPGNLDTWYSFFSFDSKPSLLYNPKSNSIKISIQENTVNNVNSQDSIKYSKPVKNIPLQKWNHIFINNIGSKCDLFLNGDLVTNISQAIPQNTTSKIITGSYNGIVGRICNIYYFKQPLNGTQILDIYHKYKKYDPPMAF